jgi:hypothetical protein
MPSPSILPPPSVEPPGTGRRAAVRRAAGPLTALAGLLGIAAAQASPVDRGFDLAARAAAHWAWHPFATAAPPAVAGARTPIDAFVRHALAQRGLQPSPPALPHVQIRRLWLDLAGLPPPPERAAAFAADPSDAAWAAEVDHLLGSVHCAERLARHWLDLVRYAESLGHESDFPLPNAWRYRDYVIRALHDDVPYDTFVREHIAGDLLPQPRRGRDGSNESVQATAAFWFVEQVHSPLDARQHQADRIDNQIDVLGKAVLGLTVACARCHDHKFDAIGTADYYALSGFVKSSRYVQAPLHPVDPDGPAWRAAAAAQREFTAAWTDAAAAAGDRSWSAHADADADGSGPLAADETLVAHAARRGDWCCTNDGFGTAAWRGAWCPDPTAANPTLQVLPGPWWHSGIAGVGRDGVLQTHTFVLPRHVHVRVAGRHSRLVLVVDGLHVVRDPIYGGLRRAVDDPNPHWVRFDTAAWQGRPAWLQCLDQRAQDLGDPARERANHPADAWLAVQTVVASDRAEPPATSATTPPLTTPWSEPPPAVRAAATALAAAQAAIPVPDTLPSLGDGDGADDPVHLRGNHRTPGPLVPRRFLAALAGASPLPTGAGSGRLALADAVLAADDPLPARVLVNRLWHHLFGRGLVRSVDNLGALGDPPTHPELLDWLARDFVQSGWSIRRALRRIATSDTYRQDSRARDDADLLDPDNLLLHRQRVRRLEAEAVRDSLLAIAGRLRPEPFGPPEPIPLDCDHDARGRPDRSGPLDGDGRRSIYLAVQRNFLSPMLLAFDLPLPFATMGARNVSNVPAQALTLLNDPFVHAMAQATAQRLLGEHPCDPDALVAAAHRLVFARDPDAHERALALEFVLVDAGERGTDLDHPGPWSELVHALLNSKEFWFRR